MVVDEDASTVPDSDVSTVSAAVGVRMRGVLKICEVTSSVFEALVSFRKDCCRRDSMGDPVRVVCRADSPVSR